METLHYFIDSWGPRPTSYYQSNFGGLETAPLVGFPAPAREELLGAVLDRARELGTEMHVIHCPADGSLLGAVFPQQGTGVYGFSLLDPRAPEDFAALMEAIPSLGLEAYHGEDIYVYRPNAVTDAHMKKVGTDYEERAVPDMPSPWTKAIVQQEYGELLRARAWLEEHCPGRYEAIFSNRYYLEITHRGCNKGGMVAQLLELLHIPQKNLYCVGDNQNDIPMLELSAIPFAPANCAQEVKDWGAQILCHCDDGVIGDIVERLDRKYS